MENLPGLAGTTDPTYADLRNAAFKRLRAGQEPAAQRISQAVRVAGVRTSGVGLLPGLEAERNRVAGEADIEAGIAGQRLGQLGNIEAINLQGALDLRRAERMAEIQDATARRIGQQQLQSALIGGGAGAAGAYLGRR